MGMRAVTGAISSLRLEGSKIVATTIGNTQPKGICGSALIDAVAVLLKLDLIGMFGEIGSGEDRIQVHDKIWLTQKDLYEFLLAKSAIAAGLMTEANWDQGISDLYRSASEEGTFCYTFFKGTAIKR